MSDTIIIGMSGGVDSAVAASVLIKNGYDVEAVFMKNWDENDVEFCTAAQDYKDALQVCEMLDIPLRSIDLTDEYWEKVFKIFLEECKIGRTPNPDIICNKEIKFRAFLDYSLELGAKKIATGHYAQIKTHDNIFQLLRGKDTNKDQSYFLYRLDQYQVSKSIFPIGDLNKEYVRKKANDLGFLNHNKKDSTGICFIGERNYRNFLKKYFRLGILIFADWFRPANSFPKCALTPKESSGPFYPISYPLTSDNDLTYLEEKSKKARYSSNVEETTSPLTARCMSVTSSGRSSINKTIR